MSQFAGAGGARLILGDGSGSHLHGKGGGASFTESTVGCAFWVKRGSKRKQRKKRQAPLQAGRVRQGCVCVCVCVCAGCPFYFSITLRFGTSTQVVARDDNEHWLGCVQDGVNKLMVLPMGRSLSMHMLNQSAAHAAKAPQWQSIDATLSLSHNHPSEERKRGA